MTPKSSCAGGIREKTTYEKKSEKRANMGIKPDSAVNGKRRMQTLFVIKNVLVCICSVYVLKIYMLEIANAFRYQKWFGMYLFV